MDLNQVLFPPERFFQTQEDIARSQRRGRNICSLRFSAVRIFTKTKAGTISGQMRNGRQWAEDHTNSYPVQFSNIRGFDRQNSMMRRLVPA